jgi:ATP-dependent Clp protease ATP-binding subunit ClpB
LDINRFTEKAQEALQAAQALATSLGHQQIEPEHLLVALLAQDGGLARSILEKAEVDADLVRRRVEAELDRLPKVTSATGGTGEVRISGRLNRLLSKADDEAKALKDDYISVEHILLAMIEDREGAAPRILRELGATRDRLMQALRQVRGSQRVTSQNPEATYEALEKYGRNLTKLASQGKLDPVIGRDDEIRRVIQVLSRRTKNNPVLIG